MTFLSRFGHLVLNLLRLREYSAENCDIFSVLITLKYNPKAKQIINLLLLRNFYPAMYQRVRKWKPNYRIQFGRSLWSANHLVPLRAWQEKKKERSPRKFLEQRNKRICFAKQKTGNESSSSETLARTIERNDGAAQQGTVELKGRNKKRFQDAHLVGGQKRIQRIGRIRLNAG